ncbi:hypothetical protein AB0C84_42870 [Actinomadura sp. NPDC048955]|uniref:hypothetical protein n=1 Tax=Actinomadura sp. NPDC048955 TaxID=3158228 RepID=UPI0033D0CAF3
MTVDAQTAPAQAGAGAVDLDSAAQVRAHISMAFDAAFTAATFDGQMAREDLFGLTMSGIGGCIRAAAYALAGAEPSDPELAYAYQGYPQALLGTWQHAGLLPWLAQVLGGDAEGVAIEQRVQLRVHPDVITGALDLWWARQRLLLDLKTVGEHKLSTVYRQRWPFHPHRLQVAGYALAKHQAGTTPRWIVWAYLDRASGDKIPVVEEFTPTLAGIVLERIGEVQWWRDHDPDQAPREERGPGLSLACDGCAWLRRCWGDDAVPGSAGPQTAVYGATDEAVDYAYNEYKRLGKVASDAEKEREFWRVVFERRPEWTPAGRWQHYTGRTREEDDPWAALKVLRALGFAVPQRTKKGSLYVVPATRHRPKK